jgi:hypothetical protein
VDANIQTHSGRSHRIEFDDFLRSKKISKQTTAPNASNPAEIMSSVTWLTVLSSSQQTIRQQYSPSVHKRLDQSFPKENEPIRPGMQN